MDVPANAVERDVAGVRDEHKDADIAGDIALTNRVHERSGCSPLFVMTTSPSAQLRRNRLKTA